MFMFIWTEVITLVDGCLELFTLSRDHRKVLK